MPQHLLRYKKQNISNYNVNAGYVSAVPRLIDHINRVGYTSMLICDSRSAAEEYVQGQTKLLLLTHSY